jgi:hypothetical protein
MPISFSDILAIVSLNLALVALIVTIVAFFASLKFYRDGVALQDNATKALTKIEEMTTSTIQHIHSMFDKTLDGLIKSKNIPNHEEIEKVYEQIEKGYNDMSQKIKNEFQSASESEKVKLDKIISAQADEVQKQFNDALEKISLPSQKAINAPPAVEYITESASSTLLAVTANQSFNENKKYNIYYDPVTRSHNTPFRFIGLYADRKIQAIGKVTKIVCCDYDKGNLIATNGYDLTQLHQDEYNRIKEIIENTDYYDLEGGHKFFLVDNFYDTDYKKESPYPLRGKRYFWLNDIEGFKEGMNAEQLAKLVNNKTWD